jgi:hypothetical protein
MAAIASGAGVVAPLPVAPPSRRLSGGASSPARAGGRDAPGKPARCRRYLKLLANSTAVRSAQRPSSSARPSRAPRKAQ